MHRVKTLFKGYKSLLLLIFLMMFFRTAYADWSHVPTSSMEPTILPGDVIWINKTSFGPSIPFLNRRIFSWNHPARGDIITFIPPHEDVLHVKRVIGVAGDSLTIRGNAIYVNGIRLQQAITKSTADMVVGTEDLLGSEHAFKVSLHRGVPYFGDTITVPEGKLFVMGDFRNNSIDSRAWGFVDENRVTGKVSSVAVSFSRQREGLLARLAIPIQ